MTGVLNWSTFQNHAHKFVEMSDQLQDGWKIISTQTGVCGEDTFYLEKKFLICSKEPLDQSQEASQSCAEPESTGEIKVPNTGKYLNCTYHVLHSQSYQVPVLYFKIVRTDGCPLSLEEIWERVPDPYRPQLEALKWSMLTQQEHPVLGQPYHCLHPCHTESLMKNTCHVEHRNYLVTWISSVGPVVGLNLNSEYARLSTPL